MVRPLPVFVEPRDTAYMTLRQRAMGEAHERGVKTLNNQTSADLRDTLHRAGQGLAVRHPAFGAVWHRVLAREVEA